MSPKQFVIARNAKLRITKGQPSSVCFVLGAIYFAAYSRKQVRETQFSSFVFNEHFVIETKDAVVRALFWESRRFLDVYGYNLNAHTM